MLQHIEQTVTGAGKLVIVATACEVGEHAGHRDSGGRTAGAHIFERHHSLLFGRKAVGRLAIPVKGVVLAARRLPHHQEHQSRLASPGHHPGICPQMLVGDRRGKQHIPPIFVEAVHIVGGHNLFGQRLVVAPDRGVILIVKCRDAPDKQQRDSQYTCPQRHPLIPASRIADPQ